MSPEKWARLLFCLFLILFFPILGWVAAPFFYFFCRKPSQGLAGEEDAFLPPLFQPVFHPNLSKVEERKWMMKELDFLPLVEILRGRDLEMKRGAIEELAHIQTPEAIRILLEYRSDPEMEIRFFVTSALGKIKQAFDETLEASQKEMQKDVYKISARIFLAKLYLQYSNSGLLDSVIAKKYEEEALYHLKYAVKSEFANQEAFELLLKLYEGREDWIATFSTVEMMEKKNKGTPALRLTKKIEALYQMGRYPDVVLEMGPLRKLGGINREWEAAINWMRGS